jgi:hypothetical protein
MEGILMKEKAREELGLKRKDGAKKMQSKLIGHEEVIDERAHENISPLQATMVRLQNDPFYSSLFSAQSQLSGHGSLPAVGSSELGLPLPGNLYAQRDDMSSGKQFKKWLNDGTKAKIVANMDIMTIPEKIVAIGKYHLGLKVDAPSLKEAAERKSAKLSEMTNALKSSMQTLEHENLSIDNYMVSVIDDAKRHNDDFTVSNMLRTKYRNDIENIKSTLSAVPHYSDARIEALKIILYAQRGEKKGLIDCITHHHKRNLREMQFERLNDYREMIQSTQIGIATSVAEGDILSEHIKNTLHIYQEIYDAVERKIKQDEYTEKIRKDLSLLDRHFANVKPMLYERTKQSLSEEGSKFFVEAENK